MNQKTTSRLGNKPDANHVFTPELVCSVEDETPEERFIRRHRDVCEGLREEARVGFALLEIRKDELWREGGHASWNDYCESICETTRSYINRLIKHAIIYEELSSVKMACDASTNLILPLSESQSRPLHKLADASQRAKAWSIAVNRAGGVPTAKIVSEVVAEIVGKAPQKPLNSRAKKRLEVIKHLKEAARSRGSWERIEALVKLLEQLETK